MILLNNTRKFAEFCGCRAPNHRRIVATKPFEDSKNGDGD